MKFSWKYIAIGAVVLIGIWMLGTYNGLIRTQAAVEGAWAQVETQYQRRFDLIPNLVNTVRGAADFEQETFQAVTEARSQWQQAPTREARIAATATFEPALGRLIAVAENYPQLQATQSFRDLMTQLEGTENRIATARRDYNQAVQGYNVAIRTFPRNLIAGILGFGPQEFFQNAPGSEEAPDVNFE